MRVSGDTEARPTPEGFQRAYEGEAPWDIGGPQPAFETLEEERLIGHKVLDAGCGTGENALFLAARGHDVTGVDLVPRALARGRAKAEERGLTPRCRFVEGDLLDLDHVAGIDPPFDTVIDSGVFHVFGPRERPVYSDRLSRVVRPGGMVYILVFSEKEPTDWGGPHRIRKDDFLLNFPDDRGWDVQKVAQARFATRLPEVEGHAWLAHIKRAD